jgi:hypothetical protein
MDKSTKILNEIFQREIDRINDLSKEGPLALDQIDALYRLVKSYSSFKSRFDQEVDELSDLSIEELEAKL